MLSPYLQHLHRQSPLPTCVLPSLHHISAHLKLCLLSDICLLLSIEINSQSLQICSCILPSFACRLLFQTCKTPTQQQAQRPPKQKKSLTLPCFPLTLHAISHCSPSIPPTRYFRGSLPQYYPFLDLKHVVELAFLPSAFASAFLPCHRLHLQCIHT